MQKISKNASEEFVLKSKPGRFKVWLLIGGFVLLVIAAAGGYFVVYSDFFKVRNFEIEATSLVPRDILFSVLTSEMKLTQKWKNRLGQNNILFWEFDKKPRVKSELLAALSDLDVETNLREKKVVVRVKERELFAVWCLSKLGRCYGIDKEEIPFVAVPEPQGSLILKFEDQNEREIKLGEPVLANREWFKNLLHTVETIKVSNLPVSAVVIKDLVLEEWEAEIYPGTSFYFSLNFVPENLESLLKNLSKQLDFKKLTYLDFRVQNRIYYK